MRLLTLIIVLILAGSLSSAAQVSGAQQAVITAELRKKGLSDEEVNSRLLQKGLDVDKIDLTNQEEVSAAKAVVEQVIAELEAEKKMAKKDNANPPKEGTSGQNQVTQTKAEDTFEKKLEKVEDKVEQESKNIAKESAQEIQEAVTEGASVQEAIAEEISENFKDDLNKSKIYGQHIFRNQNIDVYRQSKDFQPPDVYILGIGDKISISIWGISQADFTFDIDENGDIKPSGMPKIALKGITYGQAKKLVKSRFSQYYQFLPEEFELTVKSARTITVNIFGEALTYGSFTLSAYNTAFNALVAAGGPSNIGSVREIKLIRGNVTKKVDVYEFMNDPTSQFDLYLEDNDIIYIPTAERLVTISGAVKRAFRYELTNDEHLIKLIEYAGGLKMNAYKKNIQITRIEEDEEVLIDVDLRDLAARNADFKLKNGDRVSVKTIPNTFDNYVEISGAVEFPGQYALGDNMKISDLIAKGVLKDGVRLDFAFLQRKNEDRTTKYERISLKEILNDPSSPDNITLKREDKIRIFPQNKYVEKARIAIKGAVRTPGDFPFDPERTLKLEDVVLLAGGLEPNANKFAYIQRIDTTNNERRDFIRVDVFNAIKDPTSRDNITLEPFDNITIYKNESFTDDAQVSVGGAVRNPKSIPFDSTFRVSDLVYLANGLQQNAADFGYIQRTDQTNNKIREYIKVDLKKAMLDINSEANIFLQPEDELKVYTKENFTDSYSVVISGAVREPKEFIADGKLRLADAIYLSNGLRPDAADFGYIIRTEPGNPKNKQYIRFEPKKALENLSSEENIVLAPQDKINIYSKTTYTDEFQISIAGAVRTPGSYTFDPSLKIDDIILLAGGFKLEAAKNRIDIFRVLINENEPTETVVAQLGMDEAYNINSGDRSFELFPYDKIMVREVPDFELQQMVTLKGEVVYPGTYALIDKNEKISSLIKRAGGLTAEAFAEGATLYRNEDSYGQIIMRLDKVLKRKRNDFNYILREGDVITVPKSKDLVSISGATDVHELYQERIVGNGGKINVAYNRGHRGRYYVRKYAGGLSDKGSWKKLTVEHPNGEIKKAKNFGLFVITPKVRKGSEVRVGVKPPPPPEEKTEEKKESNVDWDKALTQILTVTGAMSSMIIAFAALNRFN